MSATFPDDFKAVLDFHGHLCLDIAMGYRAAKAALNALPTPNPATLVATVSGDTCAVDAIQALTGCTFGKRNLIAKLIGKHAYTWQHTATGEGVRIYVHYWDRFDTDSRFRATLRAAKNGELSPSKQARHQAEHDRLIDHILTAPEAELFRISPVNAAPPPRQGGFTSAPCAACGEYVKDGLLTDGLCGECDAAGYT